MRPWNHTAILTRPFSAAATAVLLLAGCAEPVEVGAARPSGAPLSLDISRNEVVNPLEWPDACELLTDDEIIAILPPAEDITRQATPVEVLDFGLMADNPGGGTANSGSCAYEMKLPGDDNVTSSIDITIVGVAHPKLIKRHFAEEKNKAKQDATSVDADPPVDHGADLGADACYTTAPATTNGSSTGTTTCRSGPLMFEVWGQTFATFADVPDDAAGQHWQDRVVPEVIKTVAAKTEAS